MNVQNLNPSFITGPNGERQSVILSIEVFEELLEDLGDLAKIAERRDEPTVSHEELLKELRDDGLL